MRVDPPPRIERLLFVLAFLIGVMFVMGFKVMVVMIVQVMAIHVYAAVEVAVRLPHHRAGDVLLGVAEQHGQEVVPRKRLWHPSWRSPYEDHHKKREDHHRTVWKKMFHRRFRLKKKRANRSRATE